MYITLLKPPTGVTGFSEHDRARKKPFGKADLANAMYNCFVTVYGYWYIKRTSIIVYTRLVLSDLVT